MGQALIIELPNNREPVTVFYETDPDATGLQWLEPSQTSGEHPFLISQSQAIHARSWIPSQDTPSVRFTYDATVQVPNGLWALMSADNPTQISPDGAYAFNMPQPIPAYLLALAVGDLSFQRLSEHVNLYAEAPIIDAAAYEFAETERMIEVAEALYGPYRWGQYDLLVLPPSFPFGGMENPKLSFITPTVIAGDRSLDSLIAHELAHSWSGNLVTNANWQDLWLNEGFTSYLEARITEQIHGTERMLMEASLSHAALMAELQELPIADQSLVSQNPSINPDDLFTGVPYDKGRFFLDWMEQQIGRQAMDQFLNAYFDHFAFQSVSNDQFLDYIQVHLIPHHPVSLEAIKAWLFEPGMPADFTPPQTNAFEQVEAQIKAWQSGQLALKDMQTASWSTQEWQHYIRSLPQPLSTQNMKALDHQFKFTQQQNNEIAHDWLLISIRNQYQHAYPRLIQFMTTIGRTKFIKPLYRALMEQPETQRLAKEIYFKARPGYQHQTRVDVDRIVNPSTE